MKLSLPLTLVNGESKEQPGFSPIIRRYSAKAFAYWLFVPSTKVDGNE